MKIVIFALFCFVTTCSFCQEEVNEDELTVESFSAFFVVERMYVDPNNTVNSNATGDVNFIEIIDGRINIVCKSLDGVYAKTASIEAIRIEFIDEVPHMYLDALDDGGGNSYTYIFDIYGNSAGKVIVHSRRKRTQINTYFECHAATDEEQEYVRKYFEENGIK